MVLNVNRTTKLQWKLDTIKNCKYLQCGASKYQPFVQFNFPMYETKNWQQMEGNQSLNQTTNSCLPLGIQMVSTTYQR